MKKRILSLLLAASLILALTACGKKTEEEASGPITEGRYVETDITPPGAGSFNSYLSEDGTIVCYNEGLKTRYESTDGGATWSDSPGPGANTDRYQSIQAGTPLDDGRLLVYIMGEGLLLVSPDGTAEPYPVSAIDDAAATGENVAISLLQALGSDRFLLSLSTGGIVMQTESDETGGEAPPEDGADVEVQQGAAEPVQGPVTSQRTVGGPRGGTNTFMGGGMTNKTLLLELSTGNVVAELPVEFASAATSDGSIVYVMNASSAVETYNLSDGKPTGNRTVSFSSDGNSFMMGGFPRMGSAGGSTLALDKDGALYAMRDRSLVMADSGGLLSTVLESTAYSIGSPLGSVNSLFVMDDGSIVVSMNTSGQGGSLYRYVWDDNATIDPNKTLSIWSLEDSSFVRAAITELRKKNPDASITYEVAISGDNAVSEADAIKTLNTRLLNGSGPDIILLDGCPIDSYAGKGMLLDLSSLIVTDDIYDNLLAPYQTDGKLYCFPAQFYMPVLMSNAESLEKVQTLDDLVSLAVNGNDTPAEGGAGGGFMLGGIPEEERPVLQFNDLRELCKILWLASAPAIVSDNKLDTDALRTYLTAAKAISDKYGLGNQSQGGGPRMAMAVSDGGVATELSGSLVRYVSQMANYGAFTLGNLQLLRMMMERADSELKLFPGLTPGAWEPSTVAGISADTKVQDFAVEFMKTVLSAEVQSLNYGSGLPVTHSGMTAMIDNINEQLAENDMEPFDIDVGALIAQLTVPSARDTVLTDMMWTTVERCCKGEVDIEGAVKEIEQNVKNYLAERS